MGCQACWLNAQIAECERMLKIVLPADDFLGTAAFAHKLRQFKVKRDELYSAAESEGIEPHYSQGGPKTPVGSGAGSEQG